MVVAMAGAGVVAPCTGIAGDAERWQVPAELWDRPRSGRAVIAVPAVRQAMAAMLARPEARLVVRYPPGAETALQAEELKAWLVAHALDPGRITLTADLPARQALQLELSP
jgi:hypothetical protein